MAFLKVSRIQIKPQTMSNIELRLVVFFSAVFIIWIFEFGVQR